MSTEQSAQINELATALAKAQAVMRPAAKDSVNPHFKSKYADLASMWDACREALTANSLSVVQMPMDAQLEGYTSLRTLLLHGSGQYLATTVSARLTKDDAQGIGSALTYLRRYALAAMVGIVADEDDDGNTASGRGEGGASYSRPAANGNGNGTGTRANDVVNRANGGNRVRTAHAAAVAAGVAVEPPPADLDALTAAEITEWLTYYRASMPRKAEHTA